MGIKFRGSKTIGPLYKFYIQKVIIFLTFLGGGKNLQDCHERSMNISSDYFTLICDIFTILVGI